MLFAVSGSQGSGKSTVLEGLKEKGYNVLERKISRSILADWDVSLDEVNMQPELSLRFQDEILKRKFSDEQDAVNSDDIYFTERTYMDSFVFYMYTFGSKTIFNQNINDYYQRCCEYDTNYTSVFLLPFGQFDILNDGVRNSNSLYGESIDVVLRNFLRKSTTPLHEIEQESVSDRISYIKKIVMA